MQVYFDINQPLLKNLLESYTESSRLLIPKVRQDRDLSKFDRFNKRFKISCGMKIEFTDNLPITREDTRTCYMLMLKISDLWFAFEYLRNIALKIIPSDVDPKSNPPSKVDFYKEATLEELGFSPITSNFNQLMYSKVLHREVWICEVNHSLKYLSKGARKKQKELIEDAILLIEDKQSLQPKHLYSIAYGIRNAYVHEGVAAALGSGKYHIKKALYSIVYDALVLYSLALADVYCRRKLACHS
jgi:hypothetical protein